MTLLRNMFSKLLCRLSQLSKKDPLLDGVNGTKTSNAPIGIEKIGKLILNKVKAGFSVSIADLKVGRAFARLSHFAYYCTLPTN